MNEQPKNTATQDSVVVDLKTETIEQARHDLEHARESLAKLPILGPALWLFGRDALRKFTFVGDVDWLLLPPVVLDQCRLYTKNGIPSAFFTWALVNDAIDARLRSGVNRLAPHEWKSGPHVWFIDMVSPFGSADETVTDLLQGALAGHTVNALLPDPTQGGKQVVRTWPAQSPAATPSH
jgi:cytolysin-activating lysine-acyltransferase